MKISLFLALLWAGTTACDGQTSSTARPAPAAAGRPAPATPTPRYDIRGIFDPGLGGMVAYAIKVPHGWQLQQSLTRRWIDNYPVEELYNSVSSPDGHTVFEALPQLAYLYADDPQMQQAARMAEQQGGQHEKFFLAPLLPVPYLKQVLLPLLAQKAHLQARVTAEHQDPVQTDPQGRAQLAPATWMRCCPAAANCACKPN